MPHGLDCEAFVNLLSDEAHNLPVKPKQVWSVAGSGVLTRALQRAWPKAEFHAVQIGHTPNAGVAQIHIAPEKFESAARFPPPFPSCSNYDAKAWRFVSKTAGTLFWNVGA